MSVTQDPLGYLTATAVPDAAPMQTVIIGRFSNAVANRDDAQTQGLRFITLAELTESLFAHFAPKLILAPLISEDFDAIDLAKRLAELKYTGQLRVIAENLPSVDVIRRDVRAQAPDIDFDVLVLPPAQPKEPVEDQT